MLRCVAVIAAAVALVWSQPVWAQAPERSERAPSRNTRLAPTPPTAKVPSVAPRPLRASAEQIGQTAKDSIRALDLQTEFPRKVEPVKIPIPQPLLWIGLAVALALVLYSLRDSLPFLLGGGRGDWEEPDAAFGEAAPGREIDALAAADTLSREGRFVEAMHMLLLQSLTDIRERSREQFADSLTSREILRGARLSAEARTSLREIIAAVERTYFGAYPAEPGDYAACRSNFDTLRRVLHGGAPA